MTKCTGSPSSDNSYEAAQIMEFVHLISRGHRGRGSKLAIDRSTDLEIERFSLPHGEINKLGR